MAILQNQVGGSVGGPAPSGPPPGGWPAWMKSTTPGGPGGRPPAPYAGLTSVGGPQTGGGGLGTGGWTPGDTRSGGPTGGGTPATQPFGPGNNLIGTQINPTDSQRTQNAGAMADTAAQNYANGATPTFKGLAPMDVSGAQAGLQTGNSQYQSQSVGSYQPLATTNQSGTRNYMGAAGQNINGSAQTAGLAGMGQTGGFGFSGDATGVRGQAVSQLNNVLNTTPDRASLAASAFNRMRGETEADYQKELRGAQQKNAAMGRRGSGMATTDLGDASQRREEFLGTRQMEMADNAAGLTLSDAQAKLAAAQGLSGELAGQDLGAGNLNLGYQNSNNAERGAAFGRSRSMDSDIFGRNMDMAGMENTLARQERGDLMDERGERTRTEDRSNEMLRSKGDSSRRTSLDGYGIESDQYGRARDERNTEMDFDQQQFGNRRSIFNDMQGYESGLADRDYRGRNELRGERDYQYGSERDAQNDRRQQMLDEEGLYGDEFNRGMNLFDRGYAQSAYGATRNAAGDYGDQAAASNASASDLYGEWARSRYRPQTGGTRPQRRSQYDPQFDE